MTQIIGAPPRRVQLLDPDGTPIPAKDGFQIPFVQWLPNGKNTGRMIERSAEVYAQAARFIQSGGRYAYVLTADGNAELVAGIPVSGGQRGEMVVVAEAVVRNDPGIGAAIDRLVAASIADMDKLPITETIQ